MPAKHIPHREPLSRKIRRALWPPVFEDEDKTRTANILSVTILTLFLIAVMRTLLAFAAPRMYLVVLLRANAVLVGVKVLYMSGYADNVTVHRDLTEHDINLLQKPFTIQGLTQKVRKVLG